MYAYCGENNTQVGLGCDQAQSMRNQQIDTQQLLYFNRHYPNPNPNPTLTEIKGIFKETLTPEDCLYNGGVCM